MYDNRVHLQAELLKKSKKIEYCIDKTVFERYELDKEVSELKTCYGLNVEVFVYDEEVRIIVKVE